MQNAGCLENTKCKEKQSLNTLMPFSIFLHVSLVSSHTYIEVCEVGVFFLLLISNHFRAFISLT